jgi:uncharacterized membrane protein
VDRQTRRGPLVAAGLLLGAGLGGFVDGILFHQILQWHGMFTGKLPTSGVDAETAVVHLQVNMFWDGVFYAATWLMTAASLALLWRAGARADVPWSARTLAGAMALGWGLFNLIEGVLDHHVLHAHHVREDLGVSAWDAAFLASGVALALAGLALIRAGASDAEARGRGAAVPPFAT